jgi:adenine-specific DNA-methyltransferase
MKPFKVSEKYNKNSDVILMLGDSNETLKSIPDKSIKMILTSPPYNLNKVYEEKLSLQEYLKKIKPILIELERILSDEGSVCWQVGNYVKNGEIFPLDIYYYPIFKDLGFKLRNRIVWHFNHGLHASKRLSGRYEVILWFTKSDLYTFNLDKIRIPSLYPGKTFYKPGKKYGKPSGNPLGKNPSDFWQFIEKEWETLIWDIPNVKSNHPEKTLHSSQFPIELAERCVLAFTNKKDFVLDPFSGVGSAILASIKNDRKTIGCEKEKEFYDISVERLDQFKNGQLPYRPLGKPIHRPTGREKVSQHPSQWSKKDETF